MLEKRWRVRVQWTESRTVTIIAGSKREARQKAHAAEWEPNTGDADVSAVRVNGKVTEEEES